MRKEGDRMWKIKREKYGRIYLFCNFEGVPYGGEYWL